MAWPSLAARTKNWGTETLTDADLEGQFDLVITYINDMMDSTNGHKHDATTAEGPKILVSNLNLTSGAAGDILYHNGTNLLRLAIGTALQVLRTNAGATAPEWAAALAAASQAEMEAASSTTVYATPGRTQYHPGVAKACIVFDGSGTPTASLRHNTDASITDNAAGDWTIAITTDFSSTSWVPAGYAFHSGNTTRLVSSDVSGPAAGTLRVIAQRSDGTPVDATHVGVVGFGDQA